MAITILPPEGSFGQSVGQGLGSGISSLLKGLGEGQNKQALAQQFEQQGFPGAIAFLDPQVQAQFLRNAQAAQIMGQKQQQESQLQELLQGTLSGAGPEFAAQPQIAGQLEAERGEATAIRQEALSPGAQAAQEIQNLERHMRDPRLSGDQKARLRERVEARQDRFDKKQDAIDKKTAPFAEKINTDFEAADAGDKRIGRMKELIKEGKLNNPLFASILDTAENFIPSLGVGINLKSALTPESQEFDKLSKDFLRDVKKIFGARVTDNEVRQFLKTIPTLNQSDEGKLRIINNLELFNEASKVKKQAFDDIIESNGGFRPQNIEQLVKKRTKKQLDAIADKFVSGERSKEDKKLREEAAARQKGSFTPVVAGAGIGTALGGPLGGIVGGALGASPLGQNKQLINLLSALG